MKLLEYKAKELFEKFDIPTMRGTVIDSAEGISEKITVADLHYPVVVKAQVQIGGRGKAGGIKFADNAEEATKVAGEILGMNIRGLIAKELMIVEKATPVKEWYLSLMFDRLTKSPLMIFSPMGGMEIEEVAKTQPDKIAKIPIGITTGVQDYVIEAAMNMTGADKTYKAQLKDVVSKLYKAFFAYNTMLVEINPLVIDDQGKMIALDGKVDIDDSALSKLPDILAFRDKLQEDPIVVEARSFRFLYIPVEDHGDIAVMSNGSGMMMSCIDLISKAGMTVGAGLDLGGGATSDRIAEAVRIVLMNPRINTVFLCIFGGITRCDEVAGGIKLALERLPIEEMNKFVIVRMEGTNKQKGLEILSTLGHRVRVAEGIPACVEQIIDTRK